MEFNSGFKGLTIGCISACWLSIRQFRNFTSFMEPKYSLPLVSSVQQIIPVHIKPTYTSLLRIFSNAVYLNIIQLLLRSKQCIELTGKYFVLLFGEEIIYYRNEKKHCVSKYVVSIMLNHVTSLKTAVFYGLLGSKCYVCFKFQQIFRFSRNLVTALCLGKFLLGFFSVLFIQYFVLQK